MTPPILVLDCETTGLSDTDEIWDFAAVRRVPGKPDTEAHAFVQHDETKARALPEKFRDDHAKRYDPIAALPQEKAAGWIRMLTRPTPEGDKVHLVGAAPHFDAAMLTALLARHGIEPAWSHRLICVESLTAGYLGYWVGGLSNCAEALGIDVPADGVHTAAGDVTTTLAIWDHVITNGGDQ